MFLDDKDKHALWLDSKRKKDKLISENFEHERKIKENLLRIEYLDRLIKAAKSDICVKCGGYGKWREWLARDESRVHKCQLCNGTGSISL